MIFQFQHNDRTVSFDSDQYFDLSLPLRSGEDNPNAYYIRPPFFEPFTYGSFTGSVEAGGACNCFDIHFNAHGNGTHTECVGHISKEKNSIFQSLKTTMCLSKLVTINPDPHSGDFRIDIHHVQSIDLENVSALIVRTMPNKDDKRLKQYSGTNPTYFTPEAIKFLVDNNISHLLVDTPSVDREEDQGALLSHHAFWQYPQDPRFDATITELIYVPDSVLDGTYVLNIQIASFDSDASPSRPIIFPIK